MKQGHLSHRTYQPTGRLCQVKERGPHRAYQAAERTMSRSPYPKGPRQAYQAAKPATSQLLLLLETGLQVLLRRSPLVDVLHFLGLALELDTFERVQYRHH